MVRGVERVTVWQSDDYASSFQPRTACASAPHPSEAAWATGTAGYTRRTLKEIAYGTSRPTLVPETQVAVNEAQRLTGQLDLLEHDPGRRGDSAEGCGVSPRPA